MAWLGLALIAVVIFAAVNVLDKFLISGALGSVAVIMATSAIAAAASGGLVLAWKGFPVLPAPGLLLALATGTAMSLVGFFYLFALRLDSVSRLMPFLFLSPVVVALFAAMTLGEVFKPLQYAGIALLVAGAILITIRPDFSIRLGKPVAWMLLACLFLSLGQVGTKFMLNRYDFWTTFAYVRLGSVLAVLPYIWVKRADFLVVVQSRKWGALSLLAFNETLLIAGLAFGSMAIAGGQVTLVNAFYSVQPFFVLLFAIAMHRSYPAIFKEDVDRTTLFLKTIALALMAAGAGFLQ